jgi:aconitase A
MSTPRAISGYDFSQNWTKTKHNNNKFVLSFNRNFSTRLNCSFIKCNMLCGSKILLIHNSEIPGRTNKNLEPAKSTKYIM